MFTQMTHTHKRQAKIYLQHSFTCRTDTVTVHIKCVKCMHIGHNDLQTLYRYIPISLTRLVDVLEASCSLT